LSDLAKHHNKAFAKSAGNLPISLLSAFLLFISLSPAFKPLVSSSLFTSKKFNHYCVSIFFKRQADRIATQNV